MMEPLLIAAAIVGAFWFGGVAAGLCSIVAVIACMMWATEVLK